MIYATGVAEALRTLGYVCMRKGDYAEAMTQLLEALPLARALSHEACLADTLDGIGSVLAQLGQLPEALTCMYEQLEVATRLNDPDASATRTTTWPTSTTRRRSMRRRRRFCARTMPSPPRRETNGSSVWQRPTWPTFLCRLETPPGALDLGHSALNLSRAAGLEALEPYAACIVGLIYMTLKQFDKAVAMLHGGAWGR